MKRELGQYFTTYNPFQNYGFLNWAKECNLSKTTILEPFAGSNNLINMLQNMGLCRFFVCGHTSWNANKFYSNAIDRKIK